MGFPKDSELQVAAMDLAHQVVPKDAMIVGKADAFDKSDLSRPSWFALLQDNATIVFEPSFIASCRTMSKGSRTIIAVRLVDVLSFMQEAGFAEQYVKLAKAVTYFQGHDAGEHRTICR